jgi:hypothetical protein
MAGLVTIEQLEARRVEFEDPAQAQAAIDDASAVARSIVAPHLDDVEPPATPPTVVAVVVNMVRRVIANPRGLSQETLGDYSYATGGQGVATLLPTAREKRLLRQAVGKLGASSLEMQAPLPGPADGGEAWNDDLGLA